MAFTLDLIEAMDEIQELLKQIPDSERRLERFAINRGINTPYPHMRLALLKNGDIFLLRDKCRDAVKSSRKQHKTSSKSIDFDSANK